MEPPTDENGVELADLRGDPVAPNPDGTITLYHRTSPEAAERIRSEGRFTSQEENRVFASTTREGQGEGYGPEVVEIRVPAGSVRLEDAFDGEVHVSLPTSEAAKGLAARDSAVQRTHSAVQRGTPSEKAETAPPPGQKPVTSRSEAGQPGQIEPIPDTPQARRKAFAEAVEDYGKRLEERGRERLRNATLPTKPGERGAGGTILPEALLAVSEIGAGRLIRAGATSGKKAGKVYSDIRAEFGEIIGDRWPEVRRQMVARAREEMPKSKKAASESVKARVRRTTGQTDTSKPVQTTEKKALKQKLQTEQKAAKRAERETRRQEARKYRAESQLLRSRLKGEAKTDRQKRQAIREQVVETANRIIPPARRGKFLQAAAKAETPAALRRVIGRLEMEAARVEQGATIATANQAAKLGKRVSTTEGRREVAQKVDQALSALYTEKDGRRVRRTFQTVEEADAAIEAAKMALAEAGLAIEEDRFEKRQIAADIKATREEHVRRAVGNIEATREAGEVDPAQDYLAAAPRRWGRAILDAENLTRLIEGKWRGRGVLQALIDVRIKQADDARLLRVQRQLSDINELVKAAGFESLAEARIRAADAIGRNLTERVEFTLGGRTVRINLGAAIEIAALDPTTLAIIAKGAPIQFRAGRGRQPIEATIEEIEAIRSDMAKYQPLIDGMKAIFESQRGQLFSVARRLSGREPDPQPGYFPRARNLEFSRHAGLPESAREYGRQYLENASLLQPRTGGDAPIVIGNFFDTSIEHLDAASKVIHLALPIRDAAGVVLDPRTQAAIGDRWGRHAVQDLTTHLQAAAQIQPSVGRWDRWVRNRLSDISGAYLTLNPGTYLRQLGGLFRIQANVPAQVWKDGVKGWRQDGLYREMLESSGYLWERYASDPFTRYTPLETTTSMADALSTTSLREAWEAQKKALRQVKAKGGAGDAWAAWRSLVRSIQLLNWFDAINARVAYAGWRAEADRRFPDRPEEFRRRWAGARTARVVRRTQNSSSALDHPTFVADDSMRAGGSRLLVMFQSDPMKAMNRLRRASHHSPQEFSKQATAEAANLLWGRAVTIAIGSVGLKAAVRAIAGLFGFERDEEEKSGTLAQQALDNALWGLARELAGLLPVGDEVVDVVEARAKPWYGREGMEVPLFDAAGAAINAAADVGEASIKTATGDEKAAKKWMDALDNTMRGSALAGNPFLPLYWKGRSIWREIAAQE